jgi:hypothetical protein
MPGHHSANDFGVLLCYSTSKLNNTQQGSIGQTNLHHPNFNNHDRQSRILRPHQFT